MERTYVRRRRVAAVVTIAAVVVALSPLAAGAVLPGGEPSLPPPAAREVVVQPGDTLWSIARRVRPEQDPRVTIEQIVTNDGIDAGSLAPGQTVAVPLA